MTNPTRTGSLALFLTSTLAGQALAADPVNLVYRHEFFVDAMTFDPATGKLSQHFAGKLYLPTIERGNQLISTGETVTNESDEALATVDGTWFVDPAQLNVSFDPTNPPPGTVLQYRPDSSLSHVRFTFKDGSVLEMMPATMPVLSVHFALGNSVAADGTKNYDFFFTETCVLLKETAGKGRYAGMVGTYTLHNTVTMVGPNFQVHSRGIAVVTLKHP
jgi:hypothetical protein